jgi:hypothetical protein
LSANHQCISWIFRFTKQRHKPTPYPSRPVLPNMIFLTSGSVTNMFVVLGSTYMMSMGATLHPLSTIPVHTAIIQMMFMREQASIVHRNTQAVIRNSVLVSSMMLGLDIAMIERLISALVSSSLTAWRSTSLIWKLTSCANVDLACRTYIPPFRLVLRVQMPCTPVMSPSLAAINNNMTHIQL